MNPKAFLSKIDSVKDPIGVAVVVAIYFLNKYLELNLTADEVLLASIGLGATRAAFDTWKKKRST